MYIYKIRHETLILLAESHFARWQPAKGGKSALQKTIKLSQERGKPLKNVFEVAAARQMVAIHSIDGRRDFQTKRQFHQANEN